MENKDIENALQGKDIEILQDSIKDIGEAIEKGFEGIHERQDITNGKVVDNEKDIIKLKSAGKYTHIVWFLLTASVGLVVWLIR